jgi:glyoxylase-like metal-dependent hydrolase (beta-lactamase superfamily II)
LKRKGVHRVYLPVPLFVTHVYVYLIENYENSSLILIDCGPATDEAFTTLAKYVQSIGYSMEDIETCIVTHSHYEHYGQLRRIKEECNAQILAHPAMLTFTSDPMADLSSRSELLIANGLPIATVNQFLGLYKDIIESTPPIPAIDKMVSCEELIFTNSLKLRIIWTPGHSEDHICIYNEETRTLFTGDHIISKATPQISHRCIGQLEDPLKPYQQSLQELLTLEIEIAYPGHNDVIENTHERILEILRHHKLRERLILESLNNEKLTAFEIATRVFGENQPLFGRILSCTETIAHLKSLMARGKVNETFKEGLYLWHAVKSTKHSKKGFTVTG